MQKIMETIIIEEEQEIQIDKFTVKILEYLGILNLDIYYFKVEINQEEDKTEELGLLRVSHTKGNLQQEIELRNDLANYGMISELLTYKLFDNLTLNFNKKNNKKIQTIEKESKQSEAKLSNLDGKQTTNQDSERLDSDLFSDILEIDEYSPIRLDSKKEEITETEEEYLEEEYYPEEDFILEKSEQKLVVLTTFPKQKNTLAEWLNHSHSNLEYLTTAVQICQCLSYLSQKGWYCLNLLPEFITIGKPLKLYDLTHIYSKEKTLKNGLLGKYSAPELSYEREINQSASIYVIGALLYQFFTKQTPQLEDFKFELIPPRIQQILKNCLSPITEERYSLEQLLKLLIETRNELRRVTVKWKIAKQSSLGLSLKRLTNEDSYGIKIQEINQNIILLAGVADGMGGLAQGELASQLAIQTLLETPLNFDTNNIENQQEWLIEIFNLANHNINQNIKEGGTTFSAILAVNDQLIISHVGDSRIYLLRDNKLIQLSEDHSLVNMLLASEQITEEESKNHPDRNVLIKSLGSKPILSNGYVQTFTKTMNQSHLTLKNNDLLILCSDGVWDLITNKELIELFSSKNNLEKSVNQTIDLILKRGASDNATLLVLQCQIQPYKF
jgi:protein phosphatase